MKLIVQKGRTSLLVKLFISDATKADGSGLAGLTNATVGACYRARDDDGNAAGTNIALAAGTRGTWNTSNNFVEKDATNMPGVYEFSVPNAALATGSETCVIMFKGTASMAPCVLEIQLVAYDPQDSVRAGLTALPNAAANAVGGLPVLDANSLVDVDVKRWLATAAATPITAGVPLTDPRGQAMRSNTAQSTGNSTTAIKLDAGASATNDYYTGHQLTVVSGTGAPQAAVITAYDGTTKIATVAPAWPTAPDNTSVFLISANAQANTVLIENLDATNQIRDSVFNGVVENSVTFLSLFRGCVAALLGKASGLATTTATYRDNADSKNRISATVDSSGNRSAVTLDLT